MLAYSRGSNRLAGAAPLEYRVPAIVGSFCPCGDIAQRVEQQTSVCGSQVRLLLFRGCANSLPTMSEPGRIPAIHAR